MSKCSILIVAIGLASAGFPFAAEPDVRIQEWDVPTPNSRPHDPAVSPDGALWYTGQLSNRLGRVDPRTGEVREYPLQSPGSGPHGLVADAEGKIWFTANSRGYIGKLDPETGAVTEYAMPDARARDPHTPIFDAKGILWFTVQNGNFVGKLDPRTGAISLKESPTPNSRPYGIVLNSQGIPFYCENGTNRLGRINPETLEISEYVLPAGARPRRIAITPDDAVYYTSDRGYLGRLDPRSGNVEEWLSPSGAGAAPYAIAATPDGMVWYTETGVQPNALVRFDPQSRTFERWPVPSGGGVVRHMVATPERNLYIACSGVNKVGVVYLSTQRSFALADRGGVSWTSPAVSGSTVAGYARIQADSTSAAPSGFAVFSLRQDSVLVSEAAVAVSPLLRGGRIYAEVNGPVKTGLAIVNPNDQAVPVSFYFTDVAGRDSGHGTATIAARGQIAAFLDSPLFGGRSPIQGTLTFSSLLPIAAVALRGLTNERSEFLLTTLPVAELGATAQDGVIFPHFAEGGGWVTQIVLVNPTDETLSGTVQFFGPGNAPETPYTIAPRSSWRFESSGSASTTRSGWIRLNPAASGRAPSGVVIFAFKQAGVTVTEAGVPALQPAPAFRLYVESAAARETGVAVANPSSNPTTVDFELTTLAGAPTGLRGSIMVGGREQTALFLSRVPGLGSLPSPFAGLLRISTTSAAGIAVTGLRGRGNERGDFLITTTPPANESTPVSGAELLFPHLVDGGGYTTEFVLFSGASGAPSSGMLRFFSQAGLPLSLPLK